MYKKRLFGRQVRYFTYAPPLTDLDDISDDQLPKKPFANAKRYQRSVYYYWWLFLKENEGYIECCEAGGLGEFAALYADFGDVRGSDFMQWWKATGRELFCVPIEQIYIHGGPGFDLDAENRVVVSIPLGVDIAGTVSSIRRILEYAERERERDEEALRKQLVSMGLKFPTPAPPPTAKYPVFTKPVLSALHQHWSLWQLRKQRPDLKLHELAEAAELTFSDASDSPEAKAIVVSRYLRQAKHMITYVGRGLFPVTSPKQLDLNESPVAEQTGNDNPAKLSN